MRGRDPITGAEIGATFGGGAPLIAHGIGSVIGSGLNAARGGQGALAGTNPITRDWLSTALANETPASIAAARLRMGPHGFLADVNPGMTELAAGIANRAEPPASSLVGEAYRTRQAQQRDIIDNAITGAFGPRQNLANVTRAEKADRAAAANPLYEAWRNTSVTPTPELKDLGGQLEEDGFFRDANRLLRADGRPT